MKNTAWKVKFFYSIYYFFSFSFLAYYITYFPLHCKAIGFSPFQIALASAAATLAVILGAPGMLHIAHAWVSARRLVVLCYLVCVCFYLPQFFAFSFWPFIAFWFVCTLMYRGAHALVDTQAVRHGAHRVIHFERVRAFGSLGFVLGALFFGVCVDKFGLGILAKTGFFVLIAAAICSGLASTLLRSKPRRDEPEEEPTTVADGAWRAAYLLIGANALLWASHSAFYVYFSIYVTELGWSGTLISSAWVISIGAEILLFAYFHVLESRFSLLSLLKISIVITAIRWLILSSVVSTELLLLSQLLHVFSFGVCYLSSVKLMYKILPEQAKDKGQGYLMAYGAGIGSLIGRVTVGWAAESWSLPVLFFASTFVAAAAYPFVLAITVRKQGQVPEKVTRPAAWAA